MNSFTDMVEPREKKVHFVGTQPVQFFITGFPRSRLAWISNYLSYGNMACIHDGLKVGISEKNFGFLTKMMQGAKVRGIADCSLANFQDRMIEMNPDAKWVVIERPFKEVHQAIRNLGVDPQNFLAIYSTKIDELRAKINPLVVPYDSLNESIKDIAKYINPNWKCPKWRHDMLIHMNVQLDLEYGKSKMAKIPSDNLLSRRVEPPQMTQANAEALLIVRTMCKDNPAAYRFFVQAVEAALVWDHIVDQDTINMESTNRVFENLLTDWVNNPFIVNNARTLTPVMAGAIAKWKNGRREAHYSVYVDLASAIAFILGGMDMVNKYIPRMVELMPTLCQEDDKRDAKPEYTTSN